MSTTIPDSLQRLLDRFDQQADQIRSPDYNETQIRIDFINPLMSALGWDIDNRQSYAEQYREVVHEDRVKVAGQTKAPDYSFRIGGQRKFFLEAKKPAVNIRENWEPAYQLRRYAWSAKLPCSLLTDFEELAIYDTRIRPKYLDSPATARREYIRYTDYAKRWDFIHGTFSKEAVLRGEYDRYCVSKKGRGAQEFDDAFLTEIEDWRSTLASNLAKNNAALDEQSLNFAVQRVIDRIIFLRIAEDRGTETTGQLQSLLSGPETYSRLCELFRRADERYNSGLFHFVKEKDRDESPDTLTPTLNVDDKALKTIIESLYYPKSPYEFTMVSADILGSVYERFLGKVITLSTSHRVKIEEKPEVRKAGGVYYTPDYIVRYIVANTVGKLLETPPTSRDREGAVLSSPTSRASEQAVTLSPTKPLPHGRGSLKILDPACGSGSFLIGAYQFLLDWYLLQYTSSPNPELLTQGKRPVLRPGVQGGFKLTIAERKRILLEHIHGVDLDHAAVEVTKLNLLLKCLEGETSQTLGFENRLFRERALPDLGNNIKCGNSLIGTDIIGTDAWNAMSDEEKQRINPFDYQRAFPSVFKHGGFDAVIGNPPYVRQESLKASKDYFETRFKSFASTADLFVYFIERGTALLAKGGIYSVIVSSSVLRSTYGEPLREHLTAEYNIDAITDFGGLAVFADAKDTYVCIPQVSRRAKTSSVEIARVTKLPENDAKTFDIHRSYQIPVEQLEKSAWAIDPPEQRALIQRLMRLGVPLGKLVEKRFFRGLLTGCNEAFVVDGKTAEKLRAEGSVENLIHRFVGGEDIRTYQVNASDKWMIVIPCGWTRAIAGENDLDVTLAFKHFSRVAPGIARHLKSFEAALIARQDQGDYWWELRPCDYYQFFEKPKIIFPDICKNPRFHYDESGLYLTNTAYCLGSGDKRLLGFLNSRLFWFLIAGISIPFGIRAGKYRYRLIYQYMEHIPILVGGSTGEKMIRLVNGMIELHERLSTEQLPQRREQLEREIAATDRQIDQLVYELYGLTPEEIKIVEEATA